MLKFVGVDFDRLGRPGDIGKPDKPVIEQWVIHAVVDKSR